MRDSLTPEKFGEELSAPTREANDLFRGLIEEKLKIHSDLRKSPICAPLMTQVTALLNDLVKDGLLALELKASDEDYLREIYRGAQSNDSVDAHSSHVDSNDVRESAIAMGEIYRANYENIFKQHLLGLARKIKKSKVKSNTEALGILTDYKKGKHKELFRSLIPQIRNSIVHQDCVIDQQNRTITFNDQDKTPIVASYDEFRQVFLETIYLKLAVSVAEFELNLPIIKDILAKREAAVRAIEKYHLKVERREGGPSLYDFGKFAEEREKKKE